MFSIDNLHEKYIELIYKKEQLLATSKSKKRDEELEKLQHVCTLDEYQIDGLWLYCKIKESEDNGDLDKSLFNTYLKDYYPNLYKDHRILEKNNKKKCTNCQNELNQEDMRNAMIICVNCGQCQYEMYRFVDWDIEQIYNSKKITYDKVSTMMEWLNLFLCRENKDVNDQMIDAIRQKIKHMPIEKITIPIIKKILTEMKLNKKYKYVYYIHAKITNQYPKITYKVENQIYQYFYSIQDMFNQLKTKKIIKRKNIWSYKYCLYKICEILDEKQIMDIIPKPIVLNDDSLYEYDQGWKLVMQELGYPFYRTI